MNSRWLFLIVIFVFVPRFKTLDQPDKQQTELIKNAEIYIRQIENQSKTIVNQTSKHISVLAYVNSSNRSLTQQLNLDTASVQDSIQWPKQGKFYHIYAAVNHRFVADVARTPDGNHDLILYPWCNQSNQRFSFQKAHGNFYHIASESYKNEYMKKSQKIFGFARSSALKFSQGKSLLLQLIPAYPHIPNSFYIVSEDNMAMRVDYGRVHLFDNIVQSKFNRNINQVWILRNNERNLPILNSNPQFYVQTLTQAFYNVTTTSLSIVESIKFQDIKYEFKTKKIPLPKWCQPFDKPAIQIYDIPLEMTYNEFYESIKEKLTKESEKSQAKGSNKSNQNNQKSSSPSEKQVEQYKRFKSQRISMECAKNNKIAYIWIGNKEPPIQYKQLLQKCSKNIILLGNEHQKFYIEKWNQQSQFKYPKGLSLIKLVEHLKLLFLYFQGGAYADFDTQVNEPCWQNVYTDEIIFTNRMNDKAKQIIPGQVEEIIIPEESFMMVRKKFNPQIKKMLQQEILEANDQQGNRWRQCRYRQCLILECQRHYRDNTYLKGF